MAQVPYNAPVGLSYTNIAAAGTVSAKTAPGLLASLTINSASSGATVDLIDTASIAPIGTVSIALITLGAAVTVPVTVSYGQQGGGVNFKNGLAVVVTGTINTTLAWR